MPRQLLPHDLTAAERQSGCVWASRFRSAADEIDKGGVITGTPVFERTRGVTLDGVGDYLTYGLNGQLDSLTNMSFNCVFYPAFAADDGIAHTFFRGYSAGVSKIAATKEGTTFSVYTGNSSLTVTIPAATLLSLWRPNDRNVMTGIFTSGNNILYLNGAIASLNAWGTAVGLADSLYVGGRNVGTWLFPGRIASLQFYNRLLTAEDHARIWEGGGA